MSLGILLVGSGVLILMPASTTIVADQIIHFKSGNFSYGTCRYRVGVATMPVTKYTFETNRVFKFLPIERETGRDRFFDSKTELNFYDPEFKLNIRNGNGGENFLSRSKDGNEFDNVIN